MKQLIHQILENKEAAALPSLVESGGLPALISGLSAVHRANLAAALRSETGMRLFVISPDDSAAQTFAGDLETMLGEPVSLLGMRDFIFRQMEAASRLPEQKRITAMYDTVMGKTRVTVASVCGLVQRTLPPETLMKAAFEICSDRECPPEELEEALLRCGYSRTDQVEGAGQFARRGGIIDFFSPAEDFPVRIEFWGDEIDSMGHFDTGDQRRLDRIEKTVVLPAAEALPSLADGGPEALSAGVERLAARFAAKKNSEAARTMAETMRTDADRLRSTPCFSDADRYLPLLYREAYGIDCIPEDAIVFLDRPNTCMERLREFASQNGDDVKELNRRGMVAMTPDSFLLSADRLLKRLEEYPVYMADAFTVGRHPLAPKTLTSISAKQLPSYAGNAKIAFEDISSYLRQDYRVAVLAGDSRRASVMVEYLNNNGIAATLGGEEQLPEAGHCLVLTGAISNGMEFPALKLTILTDTMLAAGKQKIKRSKKLAPGRERIESCADLSPGDYVVHEAHGIGRFTGIVRMEVDGYEKDYMKIAYAGTDCLYVPVTQLDLVTKYTGAGEDHAVKLSKMDGTEWMRRKSRAKGAAKDMADKLIRIYAERQRMPGYAFSPDSEWQKEFEENFEYTETGDQLRCTEEIKRDMEASAPMDRLLCGDVGVGKTEVALRAVMKCVLDGKQAAILVPTTVLAQQHYQTAMQRFFGFPVTIEVLNRFRSGAQADRVLKDLASGACDLVVGTHRLLSKDVKFKNLGLLVVDEEQRFGVTHKEHIKELSRGVDVLTLSATPIPRTLNMAMSGIRDMSMIEEPPENRLPVQTFVLEHDWSVLADAMRRELLRGGQVYYLHNRVEDIERTARRISELLPDVTVGVAHGQMDKNQLSSVMESVVNGEVQVLVCTTIIETGIDIPNVNTLIIEDADRLGLAQLHQIRGRVGRSTRKASAYLTFRRDKVLTEIAEKRLNAIRDFAQFGSGIKIAMRDLEIRGAGNLLGAEQSGHMTDVGYDMYMRLLNEAVLEARGIEVPRRADCAADLAVSASIPDRYVPSQEQRMDLYRRIAAIRTEEEADDLTDELIDRFGDPPGSVNSLIQVSLLRGEAGKAGITDISQKQGSIRFLMKDFDMAKVSELYAKPLYKRRLRVEAGSRPCVSVKINNAAHVVDEARQFVRDWQLSGEPSA